MWLELVGKILSMIDCMPHFRRMRLAVVEFAWPPSHSPLIVHQVWPSTFNLYLTWLEPSSHQWSTSRHTWGGQEWWLLSLLDPYLSFLSKCTGTDVTHQTCLVQWTWNIPLIQDYPGASNKCNPHSSHPSYENQPRWRRIPKGMTILRRVMAAWCLADITPPRTSQEAEETKEKWKRKVQIMFLAPSVKFRHPMPVFQFFEYLIRFWSYSAHDYTVTKPRTWPTWWSNSDENWLSSHGDIHPAIQTFISLVTMEPASLLACYSAIAADHDYTLLEGQPLSQLQDTSWYIPSFPAPPIPFVLSQCVLLLSLPSHIFFGCLRSIVRLERSYLVVTVSSEPTAYGPCLPCPCQVFLPSSFMMLPSSSPCGWYPQTYQCLYPLLGAL